MFWIFIVCTACFIAGVFCTSVTFYRSDYPSGHAEIFIILCIASAVVLGAFSLGVQFSGALQ